MVAPEGVGHAVSGLERNVQVQDRHLPDLRNLVHEWLMVLARQKDLTAMWKYCSEMPKIVRQVSLPGSGVVGGRKLAKEATDGYGKWGCQISLDNFGEWRMRRARWLLDTGIASCNSHLVGERPSQL